MSEDQIDREPASPSVETRRLKREPAPGEAEVIKAWQQQWRQENAKAIDYWNAWVRKYDLPLAEYRQL